jgi:hypothetical protein
MLIIALVLAVIGLVALVAAVVTSNELIAWVCIGASVIGVLLLIADALRSRRDGADGDAEEQDVQDYPDELPGDDSETEVVGVTDTDGDADADSQEGDVVEVSPDPEAPPKS